MGQNERQLLARDRIVAVRQRSNHFFRGHVPGFAFHEIAFLLLVNFIGARIDVIHFRFRSLHAGNFLIRNLRLLECLPPA